jgi:myo-inositol-1(or 4)-monophosphatase
MEPDRTKKLLEEALSAAREAGDLIRARYRSAYEVWDKSPENPITTADLEADHHLHTRLAAATPDIGWLSEETADDLKRMDRRCAWVVDPLDGTQEFIRGLDQFAVSVGLVENGRPLLGVVHNPATDETFAGIVGEGLTYNGAPSRPLSARTQLHGAQVLVSDTEVIDGMWARYQEMLTLEQVGSAAYKLARVAAGLGDAYISLKPKREWDMCAGVALLLAAGGKVTNLDGNEILFNQAEVVVVNGLVAANPTLHTKLLGLLKGSPNDAGSA